MGFSQLEIDRYLGFTIISVSSKTVDFIGLSKCSQYAVIFLTQPDNLHKKSQQSKSKQLSCSNTSRRAITNKHIRGTMEHMSAVAAGRFCNA